MESMINQKYNVLIKMNLKMTKRGDDYKYNNWTVNSANCSVFKAPTGLHLYEWIAKNTKNQDKNT